MSREKGRRWDGRSRIPDDTYRKNWEDIFNCTKEKKKKQYNDFDSFDSNWSTSYKEKELDPESQEYIDSLKDKESEWVISSLNMLGKVHLQRMVIIQNSTLKGFFSRGLLSRLRGLKSPEFVSYLSEPESIEISKYINS